MRASLNLVAIAAGLMPATALAQQSPASTAAIADSARACAAALTATGVDERRLVAGGWSKATGAVANGKPVPLSVTIYGRQGVLLIIAPGQPGCGVTAAITDVAQFHDVASALNGAFGAPVTNDGKGHIVYHTTDGRALLLSPSGTNGAPAVRIAITRQ